MPTAPPPQCPKCAGPTYRRVDADGIKWFVCCDRSNRGCDGRIRQLESLGDPPLDVVRQQIEQFFKKNPGNHRLVNVAEVLAIKLELVQSAIGPLVIRGTVTTVNFLEGIYTLSASEPPAPKKPRVKNTETNPPHEKERPESSEPKSIVQTELERFQAELERQRRDALDQVRSFFSRHPGPKELWKVAHACNLTNHSAAAAVESLLSQGFLQQTEAGKYGIKSKTPKPGEPSVAAQTELEKQRRREWVRKNHNKQKKRIICPKCRATWKFGGARKAYEHWKQCTGKRGSPGNKRRTCWQCNKVLLSRWRPSCSTCGNLECECGACSAECSTRWTFSKY